MTTSTRLIAVLVVALFVGVPAMAKDASPEANDVTARFAGAGFHVSGLRAIEVGGIVVLRGATTDPAEIERVGTFARNLGYQRVANVISVTEGPDDALIERSAERALAAHRSLDGCQFHIESQAGVVRVAGHVKYELQKDVAIDVIRSIDGVKEVQAALVR